MQIMDEKKTQAEIVEDTTPLLSKSAIESLSKEEIMSLSQNERGLSSNKWFVLLLASLCFVVTYLCLMSPSGIENTIITELDLSNTQYSLIVTFSLLAGLGGALLSPFFTKKLGIYQMLVYSQLFQFIGSSLLCISVSLTTQVNKTALLASLYISRGIIQGGYHAIFSDAKKKNFFF